MDYNILCVSYLFYSFKFIRKTLLYCPPYEVMYLEKSPNEREVIFRSFLYLLVVKNDNKKYLKVLNLMRRLRNDNKK